MIKKIIPADRVENVTYAVRDIVLIADEAAKAGKEMIYLNIGDPNLFDFAPPSYIVEETYKAMRGNHNGYAPSSGIKSAVEAIRFDSEKRGIANIQDIFVSTGASEAIDICLTALVNEGENILTPTPGYPLYTAIASKLRTIENPYYLKEENGWQPDIDDIKSKINDKTRGIIIINPNNPTGSSYTMETLVKLVELAKEYNLVIFADEIYDRLLLDGQKHISIASIDKNHPVLTFGGLSKNFMVPGFRIGWGVISGDIAVLKDYIDGINKLLRARLSANHPEQYAIAPALCGDFGHLEEVLGKLRSRRDVTVQMMNSVPGISCESPGGAFYSFPKISIDNSDSHFVKELIRETGVVVVPGEGFGEMPGTKHFRAVFLANETLLEKAFKKIIAFYEMYKNKYE